MTRHVDTTLFRGGGGGRWAFSPPRRRGGLVIFAFFLKYFDVKKCPQMGATAPLAPLSVISLDMTETNMIF